MVEMARVVGFAVADGAKMFIALSVEGEDEGLGGGVEDRYTAWRNCAI